MEMRTTRFVTRLGGAALVCSVAAGGCASEAPPATRTPQQWHDEIAREIDARKGALMYCTTLIQDRTKPAIVTLEMEAPSRELVPQDGEEFGFGLIGFEISRPGSDVNEDQEPAVVTCVRQVLAGIPVPVDTHGGLGEWRIVLDPKASPPPG